MHHRGPTISILAAALLALASSAAHAEKLTKTVSGTYPLASGGRFELENVNGPVQVEAWDRAEVSVWANKIVKSSSSEAAKIALDKLKVIVDAQPGRVTVKAVYPRSNGGFLSWISGRSVNQMVEFRVKVPREVALKVENVNGRVSLSGGRGDLRVETVNGAVSVSDASGNLVAETVNGAVDLLRCAGSLHASTTNGAIEAELTDLDGEVSLSSINGGLTLRLPADARATIEAETSNGRVETELPIDGQRHRTSLSGTLHGGGPRIELETTNGSIEIVEL